MDVRRFDDLVRSTAGGGHSRRLLIRRFTGAVAAAVPVRFFGQVNVAEAACRQRTERCRRSTQCCGGGQCRRGKCRCRPGGASCKSFERCCSQSCDFLVNGGTCSPCRGRPCQGDHDCCGRQSCQGGYCGGCRDRAVVCSSDSDCCFSDCGSIGACVSDLGGRCARDVDCRACYQGGNCTGACVDGICSV